MMDILAKLFSSQGHATPRQSQNASSGQNDDSSFLHQYQTDMPRRPDTASRTTSSAGERDSAALASRTILRAPALPDGLVNETKAETADSDSAVFPPTPLTLATDNAPIVLQIAQEAAPLLPEAVPETKDVTGGSARDYPAPSITQAIIPLAPPPIPAIASVDPTLSGQEKATSGAAILPSPAGSGVQSPSGDIRDLPNSGTANPSVPYGASFADGLMLEDPVSKAGFPPVMPPHALRASLPSSGVLQTATALPNPAEGPSTAQLRATETNPIISPPGPEPASAILPLSAKATPQTGDAEQLTRSTPSVKTAPFGQPSAASLPPRTTWLDAARPTSAFTSAWGLGQDLSAHNPAVPILPSWSARLDPGMAKIVPAPQDVTLAVKNAEITANVIVSNTNHAHLADTAVTPATAAPLSPQATVAFQSDPPLSGGRADERDKSMTPLSFALGQTAQVPASARLSGDAPLMTAPQPTRASSMADGPRLNGLAPKSGTSENLPETDLAKTPAAMIEELRSPLGVTPDKPDNTPPPLSETGPAARHAGSQLTEATRAPVNLATLPAELAEMARQSPQGQVELALSPEELGRVRLHLLPDGDQVRVVLSAERPETAELLRRNTDQLLSELKASGFSGAAFSFTGWGDPQKQSQHPAQTAGTTATSALFEPQQTAPVHNTQPAPTGLDLRL